MWSQEDGASVAGRGAERVRGRRVLTGQREGWKDAAAQGQAWPGALTALPPPGPIPAHPGSAQGQPYPDPQLSLSRASPSRCPESRVPQLPEGSAWSLVWGLGWRLPGAALIGF